MVERKRSTGNNQTRTCQTTESGNVPSEWMLHFFGVQLSNTESVGGNPKTGKRQTTDSDKVPSESMSPFSPHQVPCGGAALCVTFRYLAHSNSRTLEVSFQPSKGKRSLLLRRRKGETGGISQGMRYHVYCLSQFFQKVFQTIHSLCRLTLRDSFVCSTSTVYSLTIMINHCIHIHNSRDKCLEPSDNNCRPVRKRHTLDVPRTVHRHTFPLQPLEY